MTGTLEHTQLIILTAMCLHNVCIDEREGEDAEKAMHIPFNHKDGFRDAPRTYRDNQNTLVLRSGNSDSHYLNNKYDILVYSFMVRRSPTVSIKEACSPEYLPLFLKGLDRELGEMDSRRFRVDTKT